jgi:hypothetical protein
MTKTKILLKGENKEDELIEAFLRASDLKGALLEVTLVPVTPYGSNGSMPLKGTCPEYPDTDISCVGGSGENMCGCYMGHANEHVVQCNGGD